MPLPDAVAARLEGLYPVATDRRLTATPADPAAIQAHLRADGRCHLVLGYTSERFAEVDALVRACLAERPGEASELRERWAGWVEAAGDTLDAGVQLDPEGERLQVYLRGHFGPDRVAAAFAAAGCPHQDRVVAGALVLFARSVASMIGLELDPGGVGGAVYLSLPNRTRADSDAINAATAFLVAALLGPTAAERWRAVSGLLLEHSEPTDRIFVSFAPVEQAAWVKVDGGRRPLARVRSLARELGADVARMLEIAAQRGFDPVTEVGLRLGVEAGELSIYQSLR
jgi:hypothetical protein